MNSLIKLDTRGRLVIPNEFREILDIKEGDNILLSLDPKTNTITISPLYGNDQYLVKMEIKFKDKPGSLAKVASKLAEIRVDLIMTESKSYERGKKARWDIIADISKLTLSPQELKNELINTGFVEDASIKQITRDRLYH